MVLRRGVEGSPGLQRRQRRSPVHCLNLYLPITAFSVNFFSSQLKTECWTLRRRMYEAKRTLLVGDLVGILLSLTTRWPFFKIVISDQSSKITPSAVGAGEADKVDRDREDPTLPAAQVSLCSSIQGTTSLCSGSDSALTGLLLLRAAAPRSSTRGRRRR